MSRKFYGLIAAAMVLPAAVFVSGCSDDEEEELVGNWEKVSDFDGVARCSAVTFSVGRYGVCVFRRVRRLRTEKREIANVSDEDYDDDYSTISRSYGVAFSMYGLGYFTCGENAGSGRSTTWEYNPSEDLWTERTSFEGGTRSEAVGFSLDNRGFVLTGKSGTTQYDDMWEFFPTQEYDSND